MTLFGSRVETDPDGDEPVVTLHRRQLPDAVLLESREFRTKAAINRIKRIPKRRKSDTVRFAVIGDCGPGRFAPLEWVKPYEQEFERILVAAQEHGVDFSIQVGDLVRVGSIHEYARLLKQLQDHAKKPFLTVIGNHDRSAPHLGGSARLYRDFFGNLDYSFDFGGNRFIVLDSSKGRLTPHQLTWLETVYRTDKRKFVFTHMSPKELEWTAIGPVVLGGLHTGGAEFLALNAEFNVDRVYFGHLHHFGVKNLRGVRYVLTGSGGSPFVPLPGLEQPFYNFVLVEAGPSGVTERVVKLDGSEYRLPEESLPPGDAMPFEEAVTLHLAE